MCYFRLRPVASAYIGLLVIGQKVGLEFMARSLNRLSAVAVNGTTRPGRHADGGNLYLSVSTNGGRRWVFLYRWRGKPTEMGLGSVNSISLKQARELAATARAQLAMGIDRLDQTAHVPCPRPASVHRRLPIFRPSTSIQISFRSGRTAKLPKTVERCCPSRTNANIAMTIAQIRLDALPTSG